MYCCNLLARGLLLLLVVAATEAFALPAEFRGVHFNPQIKPESPHYPWLMFYSECRTRIRAELEELASRTEVNLLDVAIPMPHTLAHPPRAPKPGEPIEQWANMAYLQHVALFLDDCHEAGLRVEIDLACNLWLPHSVDTENHIANSGIWPIPDDTPWNEAAEWYRGVIVYVEGYATHPEAIAMWCMFGNHQWGAAEPVLWDDDNHPAVKANTERFVKEVWPVFRAAGKRPKASPIMLPIFSSSPYWAAKPPEARLSAFSNMKRWLVDDLALPPDYWVMSSYGFCDPAPDGFRYLRTIVDILGKDNAEQIISTDFKGPGHEYELRGSIFSAKKHGGPETLSWHFDKCREYGFAGWWLWAYQDTPDHTTGIRTLQGAWKEDLVALLKNEDDRPVLRNTGRPAHPQGAQR